MKKGTRYSSYSGSRGGRSDKLKIILILIVIVGLIVVAGIVYLSVKEFQRISSNDVQSERATTSSAVVNQEDEDKILVVVNPDNVLKNDYVADLTEVEGVKCEKAIANQLKEMLAKARQDGCNLKLEQGYVTKEQQQQLHDDLVNEYMANGMSKVKAESEASKIEPAGNYSDMQTGLSVDITCGNLADGQEFKDTKEYKWLANNCVNYGFTQRYPEDKVDELKTEFKPKRYRYVGIDNAKNMRILNMTLEKYKEYISYRD